MSFADTGVVVKRINGAKSWDRRKPHAKPREPLMSLNELARLSGKTMHALQCMRKRHPINCEVFRSSRNEIYYNKNGLIEWLKERYPNEK